MNIETPLAAIAIALGVAALIISWRRPSEMEKLFKNRIDQLTFDLKAANDKITATEQRLHENEKKMEALLTENLRLQGIIAWLRIQLREHGVEIPKLPDYLRETNTDVSRLLIQLNQGGVMIAGDATTQDIVGGDKTTKE